MKRFLISFLIFGLACVAHAELRVSGEVPGVTGGTGTGDVVGPSSSTSGNFPVYSGTTGKVIANSAYGPGNYGNLGIPTGGDLGNCTNAVPADNTISEAKLQCTNSPVDGDIPTYDSGSGGFTWEANSGGGGAADNPESWTAFSAGDATPSVATYFHFSLADTTTITTFDDPTDGKHIWVYCGYPAQFDVTDSGITAHNRTTDLTATAGAVLEFIYDATLTKWIAVNMPDETTSSVTSDELATMLTDEKGTTGGFSRVSNSPVSYSANSDLSVPTAWYSTIMLTGDDDSANETLQLQDGSFQGQIAVIIAISGIDANDNAVIDVSTDTTCVNHPADITLDSVGDSVSLVWGGSTWVYTWENL